MIAVLHDAVLRSPLLWILGIVAVQRLGELVIASLNTRRLRERGARELGRAHYPLFILLHASWLIAILVTTPIHTQPSWPLVGILLVLQGLRVWVLATLGPYWTTRIITLDSAPLVRKGPYRFIRHPNYAIVVAEIALLPITFGNWPVAIVWSVLNALLLRHRIRIETAANAMRALQPS